MNDENLKPCTPKNARERQKKSAEKRKENHAKKVLMSQIYAEFLEREYSVKVAEGTKKITGAELVNEAMKKIIARGDSSSVAVMREIREATEGSRVQVTGNVTTKLETAEERLKLFNEIVN
jgi:hypothetical protein